MVLCKKEKQSLSMYYEIATSMARIYVVQDRLFFYFLHNLRLLRLYKSSSIMLFIRYGVDLNCKQQPLIKGRGVSYCKNLLSPRFEQSGYKKFFSL